MMEVSSTRYAISFNIDSYYSLTRSKAPLLLPLFALIPPAAFSLITPLLYILLDLLCANALMYIAESGESASSRLFTSSRKDTKWDPVSIGAAYALSSSLSRCSL